MGGEKYLIGEWQAFVQQIQFYVAREYEQYCLIEYPVDKEDKFTKIDKKLIEKYNANEKKDKTYYNKKTGYANYKFLRWSNLAIILKSKGNIKANIIEDDVFLHTQKDKISIRAGENLTLLIGKGSKGTLTVMLDQESFLIAKAICLEYLDQRKYHKMIKHFNALNALPSWAGIVDQKVKIKRKLTKEMKKNLENKKAKELSNKLIINTKRTPVKVFK